MRTHAGDYQRDLAADLTPLMERIGAARLVLLGEASHGTAEFYDMRAHITRRRVADKGFNVVAVEADWPDAAVIDAYVRSASTEAFSGSGPFARFPTWMWAALPVRPPTAPPTRFRSACDGR